MEVPRTHPLARAYFIPYHPRRIRWRVASSIFTRFVVMLAKWAEFGECHAGNVGTEYQIPLEFMSHAGLTPYQLRDSSFSPEHDSVSILSCSCGFLFM